MIYLDSLFTQNQEMAYLSNGENTKLFLAAQKRLEINAIHIPNIQLSTYHYGYLVHDDFLYLERLNEIINWMRNAGLYDVWTRQMIEQNEKYLVNRYRKRVANQNNVANIENFEFPTFIFYGWLAGLIVLMLEIMWKRFGFLCKKKKNIVRATIEGTF